MRAERAAPAARRTAGAGLRSPPGRRAVLASLLAAAVALARAQAVPAFDLEALMALLAQRQSGQARFTEERFVAGFDSPLRASGMLRFAAPDHFVRETLEPQRERMQVAGNQLRLERGGRVRQLSLDAVPEMLALIEGLRGTLSGNAALLRKHFEVRVSGQARLWTLTLVPLDSALATQVRQLQIVGTASDLRSVEMQMAGQQRSLMTIEPVAPGAPAQRPPEAAASAAPR